LFEVVRRDVEFFREIPHRGVARYVIVHHQPAPVEPALGLVEFIHRVVITVVRIVIENFDRFDLVDHLGQQFPGVTSPQLESLAIGLGNQPATGQPSGITKS
jgi:hypothetical protein